jgi:hypothetical protein
VVIAARNFSAAAKLALIPEQAACFRFGFLLRLEKPWSWKTL